MSANETAQTPENELEWFLEMLESNGSRTVLVVAYALVIIVGLLANVTVCCSIRRNQKAIRNNLLYNLCTSDFFVCAVSAPVSIVAALTPRWTFGIVACKATFFLQVMPVAASTLSLMVLSLDRYISIQHPRFLRSNNKLNRAILIATVWIVALLVSVPLLLSTSVGASGRCEQHWQNESLRRYYTMALLTVIYLIPCLTVALCHRAVGHRLYAASIAAAAARGEVPLPMPINFGTRNDVIIVAGAEWAAAQDRAEEKSDPASEECKQVKKKRVTMNTKARTSSLKSAVQQFDQKVKMSQQMAECLNNSRPLLRKEMSKQSLHSRRR